MTIFYIKKHYLEYPLAALILLSILIPALSPIVQKDRYNYKLASSLLTKTPSDIQKSIGYDAKQQAYTFKPATSEQPQANSQTIGEVGYSAKLSTDVANGVSFTDESSKITIGLTPEFAAEPAKQIDGHFVYPLNGQDSQLIYTFQKNGLKEDIVLYSSTQDVATYSYKLNIPAELKAQALADGSIGIFGSEGVLSQDSTTGNTQDKAILDSTRQKAAKKKLRYIIPAPVIKHASGKNAAHAKFILNNAGDRLTIFVTDLRKAAYPLTIDPSLTFAGNSVWAQGNDEDNASIDYSTNGQISRGTTTGGSTGAWATGTNTTGGLNFIYNGSVYNVGGTYSSYAPIGGNGAGFIGSYTVTNSPNNVNAGIGGAVEYNGYVYAVGGSNSTVNNAPCGGLFPQPACTYTYTSVNTVMYSKVQPNGSLGTWQTTSSLASNYQQGGAVAYKGYLYVFDGYSTDTSNFGTTQYAKINFDGTLGTWQMGSTLTFSNGVYGATSLSQYNGYVYITGGLTGTAGYVGVTTTFYAPLTSSGIGTWQSTSAMVTGVFEAAATSYRGYLYVAGGCTTQASGTCSNNTTVSNVVQFAPIYANGSLGTWQTTNGLSETRSAGQLFGYNNYLYTMGGYHCTATCSGANLYYGDFQYANINQVGIAGNFSAGAAMGSSAKWDATASGEGYIYSAGGCAGITANSSACTSGTDQATVRYASMSPTGTLTWSTTTALPAGRWLAHAIVYGGYLYVMGGCTSLVGGCSGKVDILYAAIDSTNGTVGSWATATAQLPTSEQFFGLAASGGYLYVAGGHTAGGAAITNTVYYLTIGASGNITTSTATTVLPAAASALSLFVNNNRLYATNAGSGVIMNQIQSNGSLSGSWTTATSAVAPATGLNNGVATVDRGNLYFAGSSIFQFAKFNADGTIGTWVGLATAPTPRQFQGMAVLNNFVVLYGGCTNTTNFTAGSEACTASSTNADEVPINNGGSGTTTSVFAVQAMPASRAWGQSIVVNGFLYYVGGCPNVDCGVVGPQDTVYYNKILADGTLTNPWTSATNKIPAVRAQGAITVVGNYLYYIAGASNVSQINSTVYYTQLDPNTGAPGVWVTAASLPTALRGSSAVNYDGYIYLIDGSNGASLLSTRYTYVGINGGAPTDPAGCGNAWCYTSSLPTGAGSIFGAAVQNGNRIYFSGGQLVSSSSNSRDVYYATLSSGGIGTWSKATNPMPEARWQHGIVNSNGYVYVTAGNTASCSGQIQYAPFLSNGDLGPWQTGASINGGKSGATAAYANGVIYSPGGQPCGTPTATVDANRVLVLSHRAQYSRLFMTDKDVTPVDIRVIFSSGSGALSGSYGASKLSSPVPGTAISLNLQSSITNTQISNTQAGYFQSTIDLNDENNSSFPDDFGGQTTLNFFRISYHPNTTQRLRGGKTFNGNSLQSLDAP